MGSARNVPTIKFMLRECSLPPSGSFTVADQGSKYEGEYSFMAILMTVVAQAGSQRCHLYAPIDDRYYKTFDPHETLKL